MRTKSTRVNFIDIDIENLILVAVWKQPFIFQGYFKITDKEHQRKYLYVYRCECFKKDKYEIIENEFSPDDFLFTHLYYEGKAFQLKNMTNQIENALYLLKYSLNVTLQKMITSPKQYHMSIDEVAMSSFSRRVESTINQVESVLNDNELGFAVLIPFSPKEKQGKLAALALLDGLRV